MDDLPSLRYQPTAASPVDHARAIIQAHRDGKPLSDEALAWAATGLELHLHQGVSLPHALALVRHGGGGGHAAIERRRQRDDMLREVARRWFVDLCPTQAAIEISLALAKQTRARGRVTDELSSVLEVLVRFDPPVPQGRQLRRIVANSEPF